MLRASIGTLVFFWAMKTEIVMKILKTDVIFVFP